MSTLAQPASDPIVLLVDDDEDALELGCAALAQADLKPIGVRTLGDALRALRDTPDIDLVMTDVHLAAPRDDKSGLDLAHHISRHHQGVPVVGYSAMFAEHELAGEREVFDAFWEKSSGDYRALAEFMEHCRQLALRRRHGSPAQPSHPEVSDLSLAVAELRSEVGGLGRSVQRVEDRLEVVAEQSVNHDRVTWTVIVVAAALIGLLGGMVALAWGVAKLFGGQ